MLTHSLGFPRIGADRELKKAQEAFWKGEKTEAQLLETAKELRKRHWKLQSDQGVDLVPVGDFSLYDQVLDTIAMLGAVPQRYNWDGSNVDIKTYYQMARGDASVKPMEMSKWFDTNYHYIVPEIDPKQSYKLSSSKLLDEVKEAKAAGINVKPVLVGPFTFLKLAKSTTDSAQPLDSIEKILPVYEQILGQLAKEDVQWIQIDEPALVLDLNDKEKAAFKTAYQKLTKASGKAKLLLATYFEALLDNTALACQAGTEGLHIDLVHGKGQEDEVLKNLGKDQILSLGVVNGRNIWRVEADQAKKTIDKVASKIGKDRVLIGSSCSLLHSPVDLDSEKDLDGEIKSWLSFAKQKCQELRLVADIADGKDGGAKLKENQDAWKSRRSSSRVNDKKVQARVSSITPEMAKRNSDFPQRKKAQQEFLKLPALPTTTIGSYPQTTEIRKTRRDFKKGAIDQAAYTKAMEGFIKESVDHQHDLGLDVLVHGEPERNDMVEYFGEQLDGFAFTKFGWVQSYGSRCVKPPIIFGDVSRPKPMTTKWSKYAQSLTDKWMKGMLTGPVTILAWSFVRDDQPEKETSKQVALAIRDEVSDLEKEGIKIIQVDEAALRETLPLRRSKWNDYLTWAVESFKLTTCSVEDKTQIHTHMCYSEFNDILDRIAEMDADVISVEASRSDMELLEAFDKFEYPNDIGPGVYDIHSPRVPSAQEMERLLDEALKVVPADKLWVNPDCGLKTRGWKETLESLQNMITAANSVRQKIGVLA